DLDSDDRGAQGTRNRARRPATPDPRGISRLGPPNAGLPLRDPKNWPLGQSGEAAGQARSPREAARRPREEAAQPLRVSRDAGREKTNPSSESRVPRGDSRVNLRPIFT